MTLARAIMNLIRANHLKILPKCDCGGNLEYDGSINPSETENIGKDKIAHGYSHTDQQSIVNLMQNYSTEICFNREDVEIE